MSLWPAGNPFPVRLLLTHLYILVGGDMPLTHVDDTVVIHKNGSPLSHKFII